MTQRLSRRAFIGATAGALASGVGGTLLPPAKQAHVFVAAQRQYGPGLEDTIRRALSEAGFDGGSVRGKSVLLKPNLVEPSGASPHINTHPAVVVAAAEVFRSWDAREVFAAEGPGHCRDTDLVLEQSGMGLALEEARIPFVDLNTDQVIETANVLFRTALARLWLPRTIKQADVIVSMPKMKTHHWVGVTLSMKNLFGVMPGICYGWPKNVLHQAGIAESILDINAAVRPHLAIVDGIVGMEGDGPIMGTPRNSGVIVVGRNLPAVDATCARLMGISPWRIAYLAQSEGVLGPIRETAVAQRGERPGPLAQNYRLPPGNTLV